MKQQITIKMKRHLFILTLLLSYLLINTINAQTQIGSTLSGDQNNILFGSSVDISADGNRIAVGAEIFINAAFEVVGSVKIYELENGDWSQMGDNIVGTEAFDFLGHAVSLSSDGSVIALSGSGSSNAQVTGKVKIFEWINDSWEQKGSDILGEAIGDYFGHSMSLSSDGTHVVTGAIHNDDNGTDAGHARVHTFVNGEWVQVGDDIDGEDANGFFGIAVDISSSGNRIAVGASLASASENGHVKIYEWMNNAWVQMGNTIIGEAPGDLFGGDLSLSADGTRLAVGSINNNGGATFLGEVRVFDWANGTWQQAGADLNGTTVGTWFGGSVSLSADGNRLVVGAPLNDIAATDAGQVKIFDWINSSWTPVGMSIEGEQTMGWMGIETALSADGNLLIVAARNYVDVGDDEGIVRVHNIENITDVTSVDVAPTLAIYPNPCVDELFIEDVEIDNIQIIDIYGRVIKEVKNLSTHKIDVSDLSTGIYYLKIGTEGYSIKEKIIKN